MCFNQTTETTGSHAVKAECYSYMLHFDIHSHADAPPRVLKRNDHGGGGIDRVRKRGAWLDTDAVEEMGG
jgi:hypothetical protein